jgi:hypothetical protein
MVARMRPHSVLDVADARHVESVEPDGSACGHRRRRYATGDTEIKADFDFATFASDPLVTSILSRILPPAR